LALDGNRLTSLAPAYGICASTTFAVAVLSCCSTAGLTSLRELALDGNRLTSLAPLAGLSGLEVLLAAHNHLSSCEGVQVRAPPAPQGIAMQ
jgi:Leucine-rich repeat (LRR) protein